MGVRKGVLNKQIISADPEDGKSSVRVVTTTALPAYTRIGNVVTEVTPATGLPTIDGISLAVGESVLFNDGASSIDNGIYVVTDLGDGSNPFILTRRGDADTVAQVNSGMNCIIEEGVQHGGAGEAFILITPNPFVINVDAIDFVSDHVDDFDVDGEIITGNATPANIAQVTPPDDQAYTIWGVVTAHQQASSNTRHWLFMLSGRRWTGVTAVSEFKILNEVDNGLPTADFNVDLASPVLSFEATGILATSIRWRVKTFNFDSGTAV